MDRRGSPRSPLAPTIGVALSILAVGAIRARAEGPVDPYATPIAPAQGATVPTTTTLRWTPVPGARRQMLTIRGLGLDKYALPATARSFQLSRESQIRDMGRPIEWFVEGCDEVRGRSCLRTRGFWSWSTDPVKRTVELERMSGPSISTPLRPLGPTSSVRWTPVPDAQAYTYCLEPLNRSVCAGQRGLGVGGSEPRLRMTLGLWGRWAVEGRGRLWVRWCGQGGYPPAYCSEWSKPVVLAFEPILPPEPRKPLDGATVDASSFSPRWKLPAPRPSSVQICVSKQPASACVVEVTTVVSGPNARPYLRPGQFLESAARRGLTEARLAGPTWYWRLRSCGPLGSDYCSDGTSPPRSIRFGSAAPPPASPIQIARVKTNRSGYEILVRNARTSLGSKGNPGILVSEDFKTLPTDAVSVSPRGSILVRSRRAGTFDVRIHVESRSIVSPPFRYEPVRASRGSSIEDVADAPVADRPDLGGGRF